MLLLIHLVFFFISSIKEAESSVTQGGVAKKGFEYPTWNTNHVWVSCINFSTTTIVFYYCNQTGEWAEECYYGPLGGRERCEGG